MSGPKREIKPSAVDEAALKREQQRAESRARMREAGKDVMSERPIPERPDQYDVDAFRAAHDKKKKGPSNRAQTATGAGVSTGGTFGGPLRTGTVKTTMPPIEATKKDRKLP